MTRIADYDASLSAFYSLNDGDMDRPISFGSLSRTATAALEGSEFRVSGFVSRDWSVQGLNLVPYAGLEYSDLSFDAFTETGADALNLSVDTLDGTRLLGEAGIRISKQQGRQQDGFVPTGYLGYRFDFDHDDLMVGASLMGQSHAVRAMDRGNGAFVLGAGISGTTSSGMNLYLRYDAELSDTFSSHKASGGIKMTF